MIRAFTSLVLLGTLVVGCEGKIEDIEGEDFPPEVRDACRERTLPGQPLRRLSSRQWANVIRDLFGTTLAEPLLAETLFPETTIRNGFTNDAAVNTVNTAQSYAIEDEATRIASRIIADPTPWMFELLPCGTTAEIGDSCIDPFIRNFGLRAYRRPLTDDEAGRIRALFDRVRTTQPPTAAFAAVVQFFVQSPSLLYRIERGGTKGPAPGLVELTPYELASRLSFLFTDSGPDDELFAAAERGELRTKAQLAAQAQRLIESPRFQKVLADFHRDWLHLYEVDVKSGAFASYTTAVQAAHKQEVGELTRYVLESGGTIADVIGAPALPVNAALAGFYGVPAPASGWTMAQLPGRRGILTLGSVQAALAGIEQSQPFHRGNFVRQNVLCGDVLVFPDNQSTIEQALEGTASLPTARQRFAPTATNTECASCHSQLNPVSFVFENFDAVGAWRDKENDTTIDASGVIDLVGDQPITFANAAELSEKIAATARVQRCYALQWFRASNGRPDFAEDTCSTTHLQYLVKEHGGDLRELMVALTQLDAFRFRRTTED